jgi:mannose-1-phosphate guanylyltransferase
MRATLRISSIEPIADDKLGLDWTVALAGGEGCRLAAYVQDRFGYARPKQYCRLLGARSMLEHTLDRLNEVVPPSRTMTVIGQQHLSLATGQVAGRCNHIFRQPAAGSTGLAIYAALAMIKRWQPNAIVVVTPTDHYVEPARRYVQQLASARAIASRLRDSVVVLGVRPTGPDCELGYLSLGHRVVDIPHVGQVAGFVEKPDSDTATALATRGALWNTMVTCGSVRALWELGRVAQPKMIDALEPLVALVGTSEERCALEHVYSVLPPINFSRDILECSTSRLLAMELTGVEWSDWGTPGRVEATLARRRGRKLRAFIEGA